jgi:hypothetical protein
MDRVLLHHRRENNKIFIFYKKFVSFFFLVGVILEKENNLGGRIFSEEIVKNKIVEAGAGRFSNRHILLLKLIDDLEQRVF